jgi:hypothetical protein
MQIDRQMDMTKLIAASRNCLAKAPTKNSVRINDGLFDFAAIVSDYKATNGEADLICSALKIFEKKMAVARFEAVRRHLPEYTEETTKTLRMVRVPIETGIGILPNARQKGRLLKYLYPEYAVYAVFVTESMLFSYCLLCINRKINATLQHANGDTEEIHTHFQHQR